MLQESVRPDYCTYLGGASEVKILLKECPDLTWRDKEGRPVAVWVYHPGFPILGTIRYVGGYIGVYAKSQELFTAPQHYGIVWGMFTSLG